MSNYWNHFNNSDLGATVKEVTQKKKIKTLSHFRLFDITQSFFIPGLGR